MRACGFFRPPLREASCELLSKFSSAKALYNNPSYFKSGEINSCQLSSLPIEGWKGLILWSMTFSPYTYFLHFCLFHCKPGNFKSNYKNILKSVVLKTLHIFRNCVGIVHSSFPIFIENPVIGFFFFLFLFFFFRKWNLYVC